MIKIGDPKKLKKTWKIFQPLHLKVWELGICFCKHFQLLEVLSLKHRRLLAIVFQGRAVELLPGTPKRIQPAMFPTIPVFLCHGRYIGDAKPWLKQLGGHPPETQEFPVTVRFWVCCFFILQGLTRLFSTNYLILPHITAIRTSTSLAGCKDYIGLRYDGMWGLQTSEQKHGTKQINSWKGILVVNIMSRLFSLTILERHSALLFEYTLGSSLFLPLCWFRILFRILFAGKCYTFLWSASTTKNSKISNSDNR